MADWRTKVGEDGKAERSRRTGEPIRYEREKGKERLPTGLNRRRRVRGRNKENLTTRIARGMSYYFHGSFDQNKYVADAQEKYGDQIMILAKAKYEKTFRRKTTGLRAAKPTLVGKRISFLDEDGRVLHGKITKVDARDRGGNVSEYEVEDDGGELWAIAPKEIKATYEGGKVQHVPKSQYPYSDPKPPRKLFKSKENVMLATKATVDMLDTGLWAEPKWDGTRGVGVKSKKKNFLIGRSWKTNFISRYPTIDYDLSQINAERAVIDGELVFLDKRGNEVFLTALAKKSTIKEGGLRMVYMVYDVWYIDDMDLTNLPYRERRRFLDELIPDDLRHVRISPIIKTNQKRYWRKIVKKGAEGLMLKDPDSPYVFKRSSDWRKLKLMYTEGADTYDAVIIGYTAGKGKFKGQLGSLFLVQRVGNKWVYIGKSSGMDDDTRKTLTKRLKKAGVTEEKMPAIYDLGGYELEFPTAKVLTKPRIVIEVKAAERLESGRLRHPSFERFRPDKRPRDATAQLSQLGLTKAEIRLLEKIKK